jgi:hypothetical protein
MLPLHGSARPAGRPRIFFPPSASPTSPSTPLSHFFASLRTRTRLTNLTVSLLVFALTGSLLLNLLSASSFSSRPRNLASAWHARVQQGGWDDAATSAQHASGIPLSMETTIDRDDRFGRLSHMVMVPGHSIWTGRDKELIENDDEWVLQPIQRGGSVRTFVKHIREGVRVLQDDPSALLVFSG